MICFYEYNYHLFQSACSLLCVSRIILVLVKIQINLMGVSSYYVQYSNYLYKRNSEISQTEYFVTNSMLKFNNYIATKYTSLGHLIKLNWVDLFLGTEIPSCLCKGLSISFVIKVGLMFSYCNNFILRIKIST